MAVARFTRQQSETHSEDVAMRGTAHYRGYMYYPCYPRPEQMRCHRKTHQAQWRNSLLKPGISHGLMPQPRSAPPGAQATGKEPSSGVAERSNEDMIVPLQKVAEVHQACAVANAELAALYKRLTKSRSYDLATDATGNLQGR